MEGAYSIRGNGQGTNNSARNQATGFNEVSLNISGGFLVVLAFVFQINFGDNGCNDSAG